jgi:hypothetical protein
MSYTREDIGFVASTIVAAIAAIAAMKFDETVGIAIAAFGALAGSIFSYFKAKRAEKHAVKLANIPANATIETTAKTVLVQTITNERAKWRSEIREAAAELIALLRASKEGKRVDWQRVVRLQTDVRLRLNPHARQATSAVDDIHEIDRRLHKALDDILASSSRAKIGHGALADSVEKEIGFLLKNEWEKSKSEAVTGRLEAKPA